MTAKRDDESQTEYTIRLIRDQAQREALQELRSRCRVRAVSLEAQLADEDGGLETAIRYIDEKLKELS